MSLRAGTGHHGAAVGVAARRAGSGVGLAIQDKAGAADQPAGAVLQAGPKVDGLADALSSVLADASLHHTARQVAEEIAALPPTTDCVAALDEMAGRGERARGPRPA